MELLGKNMVKSIERSPADRPLRRRGFPGLHARTARLVCRQREPAPITDRKAVGEPMTG